MKRLAIALAVVASVASFDAAVAAPKTHVVSGPEANGGILDYFYGTIRGFRASGTRVVLQGHCMSACTLYTSLMRDGLLCARPGTTLVFHRPVHFEYSTDAAGVIQSYRILGPLVGPEAGQFWATYPRSVRREVMKLSPVGLPRHGQEISIPAETLGIPTC